MTFIRTQDLEVKSTPIVGFDASKAVTSKDFANGYNPKIESINVRRTRPDSAVSATDVGKLFHKEGSKVYTKEYNANGVVTRTEVDYRNGVATVHIPTPSGTDLVKSAPQAKYGELCARIQTFLEVGTWSPDWDATFSDGGQTETQFAAPVEEQAPLSPQPEPSTVVTPEPEMQAAAPTTTPTEEPKAE